MTLFIIGSAFVSAVYAQDFISEEATIDMVTLWEAYGKHGLQGVLPPLCHS